MIGILQKKKNELLCELLTYWQYSTYTLKSKFPVDVIFDERNFPILPVALHISFFHRQTDCSWLLVFFSSFNSRLFSPHQTYITLFIPSNSISAFLLRCDIYKKKENDEMTLGKTNGTIGNRVTVIFNWIYWNLYNEHFLHILWATINVYFLFARHIVTLQKMHHHHKSAFLIPWYWW